MLAGQGVREINVISQDTLSYAKDLAGRPQIAELIRALDGVEGTRLGAASSTCTRARSRDAVLDAFAGATRVLPYFDVPLQHASDRLLRAMKRGVTAERQRKLVEKLRARIPGCALRTTFIVGFPGETDADFAELCDFVREVALRPARRVPLLGRRGHGRLRARRQGPEVGLAQAPPRADGAAARDPAREARARRWARRCRCWSTRPGATARSGGSGRRRPRSTARCSCAAARARASSARRASPPHCDADLEAELL